MRYVFDFRHESVVVALDIEDYPVASNDTGATVLRLYLRRRIPILLLDFPIPSKKRLFGVRMPLPELERPLGDDPHRSYAVTILILSNMPKKGTILKLVLGELNVKRAMRNSIVARA